MLKGMHYRARNYNLDFEQEDIPFFRVLITLEIINGKLYN